MPVPESSSLIEVPDVVVGESPSADNVVATQALRAPTFTGEVASIPTTTVDEANSSQLACAPAELLSSGSRQDELDVLLRDLFFAPGSSGGPNASVEFSSHVGESACPQRKKVWMLCREGQVMMYPVHLNYSSLKKRLDLRRRHGLQNEVFAL